jgi:hypothetical protein
MKLLSSSLLTELTARVGSSPYTQTLYEADKGYGKRSSLFHRFVHFDDKKIDNNEPGFVKLTELFNCYLLLTKLTYRIGSWPYLQTLD